MAISYNKYIYDAKSICNISLIHVDQNLNSFSKTQILWNIEYV